MKPYCPSRYSTERWLTREVRVGSITLGGTQPIRVQSMTTTNTCDIGGTVRQTIELAEAGCEIVRITAPTMEAGVALCEIRKALRAAKIDVPLVADIHFLPKVAMEAVNHVDKVRINPGNYADRKTFKIREYSDDQYEEELERLHGAFSPIVKRCKELGKAMRIGTNHGSLSDRIMNRYGDTPLGMVESALEFIRIAESHHFHDIVLSMKASNPKVMIQAYRLAVARMREEGMNYPLHLGVTEAGDGEDARIKSTIGIGSLLYDGLGDTIRVSLTEDPIFEIPVARQLAERANRLQSRDGRTNPSAIEESVDPFSYTRSHTEILTLGSPSKSLRLGGDQPVRVWVRLHGALNQPQHLIQSVCQYQIRYKDTPIEGILLDAERKEDLPALGALHEALESVVPSTIVNLGRNISPSDLADSLRPGAGWIFNITYTDETPLAVWLNDAIRSDRTLAVQATVDEWRQKLFPALITLDLTALNLIATLKLDPSAPAHPLGQYRQLAALIKSFNLAIPLWIRLDETIEILPSRAFGEQLVESALLAGPLLCDGLGDVISIENVPHLPQATVLGYNILQGARTRISKTEYVACPSCGRTLFDLQSTTARVKAQTSHLKGVTIAVMGCIVNGPGEMADADFGYVGGAPGKINLYVGKKCVKTGISSENAVDELVALIKEHGKWVEPEIPVAT